MRHGQLNAFAVAMAISTLGVGIAQAQIVGQSSDPARVVVGSSTVNGGPHVSGRPGIAVRNTGLNRLVDFQGLQEAVESPPTAVTEISAPTGTITDHSQIGVFHFTKVSNADLYFGEWKQTANVAAGDHTVYYVGRDPTTVAPAAHSASYTVRGINDYANRGTLLNGTFNATFNGSGGGALTGSVAGGGLTVDIGTATITGANFAGSSATATTASGTAGGNVNGTFYGNNAAALAGVATFGGNRALDTAFGGTKN